MLRDECKAKITFYEDLKNNFEKEVKSIADFVGWNIDNAMIQSVKNETSLKSMKQKDKNGKVPVKVRNGLSCGFLNEISEDAVEIITDYMEQVMDEEMLSKFDCA